MFGLAQRCHTPEDLSNVIHHHSSMLPVHPLFSTPSQVARQIHNHSSALTTIPLSSQEEKKTRLHQRTRRTQRAGGQYKPQGHKPQQPPITSFTPKPPIISIHPLYQSQFLKTLPTSHQQPYNPSTINNQHLYIPYKHTSIPPSLHSSIPPSRII